MNQKTIAMATAAATTQWPTQPTQWTREEEKIFDRALSRRIHLTGGGGTRSPN
ncbi:hypothetical protein TSUD_50940 [Trifolium subterraneum]|uniref:Uncharacterized protein n=1 Tax=Trifolium subterraneum TaxID=3900 RepID=A0A2Z6MNY0_TRISU|nr:hypothetical protein TSUD_50940 [Trifolium subterraneum]